MSVRVRFAPSPTGLLHVGALRTVVFNDLFARGHQGDLLLRIEDTDRTRYNADSEKEFIDSLKWVGIEFDEGPHVGGSHAPYRQSERKEAGIYQKYADQLLAEGKAYRAFETAEELDQMREFQRINKMATGYFGGDWRDASAEKTEAALAEGKPFVVRLKIPHGVKIKGVDSVRGNLEWDGETVDDPVLIKADGMPTYHFAAMVDDHLMGITHVFRGEEWIASYPKHIVLFEAFGWTPPVFVHCPVIVGTDGKKLSKRHGATRVLDYAAQGYLPQPLKNFVALIGWSPGDEREVMNDADMANAFNLKGIQPSPGRFDMEKLDWMNGLAIRAMSIEELESALKQFIADPWTVEYWTTVEEPPAGKNPKAILKGLKLLESAFESQPEFVRQVLPLEQQRVNTLADFGTACEFFLLDEVEFDSAAVAKAFAGEHVKKLLGDMAYQVSGQNAMTPAECEAMVKDWASANGFEKIGPVIMPIRVAMTGQLSGPGLFDLMSVLGPQRVKARFERALEQIG
ncbi:MAG: glutamate--tRNA ligase [Fimbriimonadaceae bacterium]|nr:glutamate--tRNA ligase [Fimbriimonadaceae bacterium]